MSETLFDLSPYKSASANSYHSDYIDAISIDPAWDKTELSTNGKNSMVEPPSDAEDNSTQVPTVAEPETSELNHAIVEVIEELSPEEEADRQRLELKVERAFYEAGAGLRELRDRRLYRSTHKTFEKYCLDRFGFQRRHSYRLLDAATVVDNLCPIGTQVQPTNERQVRDLVGLEPEEQRQIWAEAVRVAGGKLPSGRVVQSIVQQMKERSAAPPDIPFQAGDVVLIRGAGNPDLRRYDGRWAIAIQINEYSVSIALNEQEIAVKPQCLEEVELEYWAEIRAVNERITRLRLEYELDPIEDAGLEVMRRRTVFTPKQMLFLQWLESNYGIISSL